MAKKQPATVDTFVGHYDYSIDRATCERLIDLFEQAHAEQCTQPGMTSTEVDPKRKDSVDLSSWSMTGSLKQRFQPVIEGYFKQLNIAYGKYLQRYPELRYPKTFRTGVISYNIQRYLPGGQAYHAWHYESPHPLVCNRVVTWMSYLNTVKKGGETEFKYYGLKAQPKQGTTLIWPAAYTHTHRGLPAPREKKYIITGWFEFLPEDSKPQ